MGLINVHSFVAGNWLPADDGARPIASAVTGDTHVHFHPQLWHGLTPALYMSIIAVLGGALLLVLHRRAEGISNNLPRPEAKVIYEAIIAGAAIASRRITDGLHDGALTRYAAILVVFTLALAGYADIWMAGFAGLGFIGLISAWVDQELLVATARAFPADHVVLIGGADVPVETLAAADIAINPYRDTLVNRAKCAAKLRDLLAAGVPVVAEAVGHLLSSTNPSLGVYAKTSEHAAGPKDGQLG